MKYTVKTYGWSAEFIGKTLSEETLSKINELMEENGVDEIWEIRFDLDDLDGFDIWDGDVLHMRKAFDNETMLFEIFDESETSILEFGIENIGKDENTEEDDYEVFPSEDSSIYFSIDEFKGGIFSYEFESDDTPKADDFTYLKSSVLTPEGEWGIIDKIYYKGNELEVIDHLDSFGKSSTISIFTWEE